MKKDSILSNSNAVTLAIIGCGAITETFYLPAFNQYPKILERLILVDTDLGRAKNMADRFHVSNVSSDYNEVLHSVDGVIIAVPHHLHYLIAKHFLAQGVHVLCEKPLTDTVTEAQELIHIAETNNIALSINLTRRLMSSSVKVKELLSTGAIGKVRSIRYLDGSEFDWPTASGFYFDFKISQKGILLDIGSHVLDLICWWLGGRPSVVSSENDSFGGCESVSSLNLDYHGASVSIRLSRLSKLPNNYVIVGERGSIEGMVYTDNNLIMKSNKGLEKIKVQSDQTGMDGYGRRLVTNFIDVVVHGARPLITANEILDSIELLEEAYHKAKRFSLPWYNWKENSYAHRL